MQALQPLAGDVGVDGGGGDVGVAQQHLHGAQVGAVVEQVGGEGVAQGVGGQGGGDVGGFGLFFHDHPEHHPGHAATPGGDEQVAALLPTQDGRAALGQVAAQPLAGYLAEGHQALLGALAQHPQHAVIQAHIQHPQAHQLTHPQAAGVHQLQHGAVAQAQRGAVVGGAQQRLHLRLGQDLGHPQRLFGRLQPEGGVHHHHPLTQRPVEIALEDAEPPVGRGGAGAGVLVGEIAVQQRLGGVVQRQTLGAKPAGIQREVAPVGLQGVGGQAILQPQGVHKAVNAGLAGGVHEGRGHQKRPPACAGGLAW